MKAKRFQIVGENRQVMVSIGSSPQGGWIIVNDKNKTVVQIATIDSGSGTILTYGIKGQTVRIGANARGSGVVNINNKSGIKLITIGEDFNGEGRILQYNQANKLKAIWPPLR